MSVNATPTLTDRRLTAEEQVSPDALFARLSPLGACLLYPFAMGI
jgi:hypothetical protein